ncbi:isoprenyl transferase [Cyclobacteriaceae bacterium]|nr:isoprenyl transferase [Cyclobacteriaceae bacterium]
MNLTQLDKDKIPSHIAIIMDGNGRWAKKQGEKRTIGHENGVNSVRDVVEAAVEYGINHLTLYAFSTENWNRPKEEIDALMEILVASIAQELPTMMKNNIKLTTIGNTSSLPENCQDVLKATMDQTKDHKQLTLNLALSYSGRWDILNATKEIAKQIKSGEIDLNQIDESLFSKNLTTNFLPDPDLLIRTSGEYRISNFLLWELAYTEILITDVLWPDFRKSDLKDAIINYQQRERRFGKTSAQLDA